jgi:hypothetical protein
LSPFLPTGTQPYGALMAAALHYEILLADGLVVVDGADAYAPDGQMTTFYRCRDGRDTIDVWATRVASFRTADIVRILRIEPTIRACVA